jgi:MFS family permease
VGCFAFALPLPEPKRAARTSEAPGFASLLAGVRFVWQTRLMLAAMTLDLFAVLLGGATYLLPIFSERLGHGSAGYGYLRAAPAVGAFSMAMIQAHMPPLKRAGRTLLLAVAGFGAATIVFGFSTSYWLSLFMLALTGAFDNVSVVVRHTLVQLLTPDSMRGRVSAVNQVFIGSSNELGGMESGLTAAWLGPVTSVVGGGIGTILVVILVAMGWPQVRRLGKIREVESARD